jgi:hypothetical protein
MERLNHCRALVVRKKHAATESKFRRFLSRYRSTGIIDDEIPASTLEKWWNEPSKQKRIIAAYADCLKQNRSQGTRAQNKEDLTLELNQLRKEVLRDKRIPELPPMPNWLAEAKAHEPSETSPDTLAFNAKILPGLESDSETGIYYTAATLAAMNLPGWADELARVARAATDERHREKAKKFLIELGKALASRRSLWDRTDELILCNYYETEKFEKPLCQITEEEGSALIGLSPAAYDKRLQRLALKRRPGRPRKQDKSSRTRS